MNIQKLIDKFRGNQPKPHGDVDTCDVTEGTEEMLHREREVARRVDALEELAGILREHSDDHSR